MLEKGINSHFPDLSAMGMKMNLNITNPTLLVDGRFHTPILSGAVYHQSTFRDLLIEGLSATVGLRLDYEKNWMKYNSGSTIDYQFNMTSPFMPVRLEQTSSPRLNGKFSNDYLQLLPKFALQYEWKKGNNVYATVSRGYRSGGYNIQMFSDLIQGNMQNDMQGQIKAGTKQIFDRLVTQACHRPSRTASCRIFRMRVRMRIRKHRPSTSPNIPGITKWAVTSLCGKVSYGWILPPS